MLSGFAFEDLSQRRITGHGLLAVTAGPLTFKAAVGGDAGNRAGAAPIRAVFEVILGPSGSSETEAPP